MISARFMRAGLLQFGAFTRQGKINPFDLSLHLIGSYPDLLRDAADDAARQLQDTSMSRVLATADAVPFGVALALRLNIPLVYSRGMGASPVDDLVGAYDIGHPALLVTNSTGFDASVESLIKGARRVGLEIHTLVTLLECRPITLDGVEIIALVKLSELVDQLAAAGDLATGQAALVQAWLKG